MEFMSSATSVLWSSVETFLTIQKAGKEVHKWARIVISAYVGVFLRYSRVLNRYVLDCLLFRRIFLKNYVLRLSVSIIKNVRY